jgi:hypothetical protein
MEPVTMALIGGGLMAGNAIGGFLGSQGARKAARDQRRALREAQGLSQLGYQQGQGYLERAGAMYDPYSQAGQSALSQLASLDTNIPIEEFGYEGNVNQFLDPSMAFEQEQARRALEQSAVSQGNVMGTGTAKLLQQNAMNIARQGYGQAHDRMSQDRGMKYQQFIDRMQQRQMNLQNRLGQLQGITGMGFNATANQSNLMGQGANLAMGNAQNQANLAMGIGEKTAQISQAPYVAGQQFLNNAQNIGMGMMSMGQSASPQGYQYMGNAGMGYK